MKEGNNMPLYRKLLRKQTRKMKKVNKSLNGSTNRPVKKNNIHVSKMWKQLKFKVRFCKLTALSTQHSKSKKTAPKVEMKDTIQKTVAHHLPPSSLSTGATLSELPRKKKEQKSHHRQIVTHDFLFQICENPKIISQNWPHKDLKRTSIYKTLKNQDHRS